MSVSVSVSVMAWLMEALSMRTHPCCRVVYSTCALKAGVHQLKQTHYPDQAVLAGPSELYPRQGSPMALTDISGVVPYAMSSVTSWSASDGRSKLRQS